MPLTASPTRGFTLVELATALVLTLMAGGVAHRLLLDHQRVARAQAALADVQDQVRTGALLVAGELREAGYDVITAPAAVAMGYAPLTALRPDLLDLRPGRVDYLASRGFGFVCHVATTPPVRIVVDRATWSGLREPTTSDSLVVFVENAPGTDDDDAWVHFGIAAVGTESCPAASVAGGAAGRAFTVTPPADLPDPSAALAAVANSLGGPVRLTEPMRMQYYRDAVGRWYLGMRALSTAGTLQPAVGPLADSTGAVRGLTFEYLDAADLPTSVPADVRSILVTLTGVTDQPIYRRDRRRATADTVSLTARIALRNTLR